MHKIAYWLSLALIFTVPWEAVVEFPFLGTISRIFGIVAAAFWLFSVAITGRLRRPTPFHIFLILYIAWNAVSIFWSADFNRTLAQLGTWVQLLLLSYILWDLYVDRSNLLAGLQMFVLGAYVALGSTLGNFVSGKTYYYERFSAASTNPDDLGSILAIGIPIAWYLCIHNYETSKFHFLKWINYAYIPAALFGIALSATRTALVIAVPGILFCVASIPRLRFLTRIVVFGLIILSAVYLIPQIPEASISRLNTISSELSAGDLNGRFQLWRQGLEAFEKSPLLGVGSNMYRSTNAEWKVAHNSFISVLVELGLVGFILFSLILAYVIIQALQHTGWDRYFWLTVLTSWAITASTLTWEYRKPTWVIFNFIVISLAITMPLKEPARVKRQSLA